MSNNISSEISNGYAKAFDDGELLKKVYDITIRNRIVSGVDPNEKVVEFLHPLEVQKIFKLAFQDYETGADCMEEIDIELEKVVKYSVKTTHPNFYNQLYHGIEEVGLAAAWLTESLNTNIHTYECGPVFTVIERHMIKVLGRFFDWEDADGIFSPGGSISNMYGIALARHRAYPNCKNEGLFGMKPLVILTSDMSHYSMQKAGGWMGFGTNQVISVKSDSVGRMRASALKEAIKKVRAEGREPFFVNATSGTTVFGAFDPLHELADVCEEEGLWLHVDACWGGGVMMSQNKKSLMKGIERVDSVAWNAHKMIGAPLQCSPFLVKHKGLLSSCNQLGASYLFQPDKCYDVSYDSGDMSVQCGRKPDAFKLWLMFKVRGIRDIGNKVDIAFRNAKYLENCLRTREGFRLVLEEHECTNICFWYIPPSLRGQEETEEWHAKLQKVAPAIKKGFLEAGTLMVGYQPMASKGHVNFFRMVITCYPTRTKANMDFILNEVERIGGNL